MSNQKIEATASAMPGTDAWTLAVFSAKDVPVGTVVAPVQPVAVPDEVIVLLTHIADVIDGENWKKIDTKLWNTVTMRAARAAQGDAVEGELLKIVKSGAETDFPGFLDWIADRLVNCHGENPNVDYVQVLRLRASQLSTAIAAKVSA